MRRAPGGQSGSAGQMHPTRMGAAIAITAALWLGACGSDDKAQAVSPEGLVLPAGADSASRPLVAPVVDPYVQVVVIGPSDRFDLAQLPQHWYAATAATGGVPKITLARQQNVLALRLTADLQGSLVGRKINIPLLNMPYLRWGWFLEPAAAVPPGQAALQRDEPEVWMRVVVGIRISPDPAPGTVAPGPPQIERTVSLEWRAGAAQPPAAGGSVAMRLGGADAGKWLFEAVDLSRIFSAAWPQDNIGAARIVFVAVGAGPTAVPAAGYIAEVVLAP